MYPLLISSSWSRELSMTMGVFSVRGLDLSFLHSSIPSMTGISTSVMIRSNSLHSAISKACCPFSAWVTSTPERRSSLDNTLRTTAESSTTRMRNSLRNGIDFIMSSAQVSIQYHVAHLLHRLMKLKRLILSLCLYSIGFTGSLINYSDSSGFLNEE